MERALRMFEKFLDKFRGLFKTKSSVDNTADNKENKAEPFKQGVFLSSVSEKESRIINNPAIPKVLLEKDPALRKSWMIDLAKDEIKQYKNLSSEMTNSSQLQGNVFISANRVLLNSVLDQALHLGVSNITLISAKADNTHSLNLWDATSDIVAHRLQELFLLDKNLSAEEFRDESAIIEYFVSLTTLAASLNGSIPSLSEFLRLFDDHRHLKESIELVKNDYEQHQSYEEMDKYSQLLFGKKSNLNHSSLSNRTNIGYRMSQLIMWFDTLLEGWNSHSNKEMQMHISLVRKVIKTGNDIHKTLADQEIKHLLLGSNQVSLKELIKPKNNTGVVLILIPEEKKHIGRVIIDSLFSNCFSYYTLDTFSKDTAEESKVSYPLINICLDNWSKYASNAQLFWISQLTGKRITLLASADEKLAISNYSVVTRVLCYIKRLGLNGQYQIVDYQDTNMSDTKKG